MVVQSETPTSATFCYIQSVTYQLNCQPVLNQSFILTCSVYKLQLFIFLDGSTAVFLFNVGPISLNSNKNKLLQNGPFHNNEGTTEIIRTNLHFVCREVSNSEETTASIKM